MKQEVNSLDVAQIVFSLSEYEQVGILLRLASIQVLLCVNGDDNVGINLRDIILKGFISIPEACNSDLGVVPPRNLEYKSNQ